VIVLGFDTATPATVVGLRLPDGSTLRARDDPAPGAHPGHATRLLPMIDELLGRAGFGWTAIGRIAVGLGPGTFTGLRVGVATARGLAQSLAVELVSVSSLRALAAAAMRAQGAGQGAHSTDRAPRGADSHARAARPDAQDRVLAVIDARRGEAFAAAYAGEEELMAPQARAPERLSEILTRAQAHTGAPAGRGWLAVGDGAVRFRGQLEAAGASVPPDSSPLHRVDAVAICELGACAPAAVSLEAILPDYRRRPDAELARQGTRGPQRNAAGGVSAPNGLGDGGSGSAGGPGTAGALEGAGG
jgi:tRNA threonylcarbamoyladenosine biosynthesis protein TsaB